MTLDTTMSRTILVATDGGPGAMGALRLARLLGDRDGARIDVLTVYEPAYVHPAAYADGLPPIPTEYAEAEATSLHQRVAQQVASLGRRWTERVDVVVGPITPTIARVAEERGSDLILIGFPREAGLERWWGRETLLGLIHQVHVPVLAAPAELTAFPTRAVVGIDFSDASLRAAREAARQLGPAGRLHLVHVLTGFEAGSRWAGLSEWVATYRSGVEHRLAEFADELARSTVISVWTHVRQGDPSRGVLGLVEETGADLVAVGSHGMGFFGRVVVGSVSGRLVHRARIPILVAPPPSVHAVSPGNRESVHPAAVAHANA